MRLQNKLTAVIRKRGRLCTFADMLILFFRRPTTPIFSSFSIIFTQLHSNKYD